MIVRWTVSHHPSVAEARLLPVAAETWDGYLNDINGGQPDAEDFAPEGVGSIIAIVATDVPLLPNQCRALARRVTLGLARTGTPGSHFSGDLFLAVSTANPGSFTPGAETLFGRGRDYDLLRFVPWGSLDPFYEGVVQATEEAVVNALVANEEVTGFRGHRTPALPRERLVEELSRRGV